MKMDLETLESQLRERVNLLEKRITTLQVLGTISLLVLFGCIMLVGLIKHQTIANPRSSSPADVNQQHQVNFFDGVSEVTLQGGMIRMDLTRITTDENGERVLGDAGQMVLTPEGFLRSFSAMENLVEQLINAGLIEYKDKERKFSPND